MSKDCSIHFIILQVGLLVTLQGCDKHQQIMKANTNLSATLAEHTGLLYQNLAVIQHHCDSLAQIVLDNYLALDCLLAQKGVCTTKGTTCHMYINDNGQIKTYLYKMSQQGQEFHNLTQVFNQIPTITFYLFLCLDLNKWGDG